VIECGTLKVAVLMGGIGAERKISIQSGNCIAEALGQAGLNVVTADIVPSKMDILQSADIDVFFIALHGEFGEDGQLQQILETHNLIYTGSGPIASKLAFDKRASKKLFADAGVSVPEAVEFGEKANLQKLEQQLWELGDKFVIKPQRQGSSVGVSIVDGLQDAIARACKTRQEFGDCIIEKFIPGREITVGILQRQALPIIEIKSKTGFYDYQAKYVDQRTGFLFDTIEDESLKVKISQAAIDCFDALGCQDFARVDFILGEDGSPYALEVNTIPGFTTHSLLPKAAERAGLSMSEFCVRIVELAIERRGLHAMGVSAINRFYIQDAKRKAVSNNRNPRLSNSF
jgi:D-alanine-D-alanine ligase